MSKNNKSMQFEQQLKALEDIVSSMENGTLSLDDSLKAFEKGVSLTRSCMQTLDKAELKVKKLSQMNETEES